MFYIEWYEDVNLRIKNGSTFMGHREILTTFLVLWVHWILQEVVKFFKGWFRRSWNPTHEYSSIFWMGPSHSIMMLPWISSKLKSEQTLCWNRTNDLTTGTVNACCMLPNYSSTEDLYLQWQVCLHIARYLSFQSSQRFRNWTKETDYLQLLFLPNQNINLLYFPS